MSNMKTSGTGRGKGGGTPWWKHLAHAPRDLSRLLRGRRRKAKETCAEGFLHVPKSGRDALAELARRQPEVRRELDAKRAFLRSNDFDDLVAKAAALEPNVPLSIAPRCAYLAPWHDLDYRGFARALNALPKGAFDRVILVPFGMMGGADYVAGLLAETLSELGTTLILRTDASGWDRPDWYPADVPSVDLSVPLAGVHSKSRALYFLLQVLRPKAIFNVNSRLGYECFEAYGARLAQSHRLFSYYFCADRLPDGGETGYPVWYMADILPHLTAALVDSRHLTETIRTRYALPSGIASRLCPIYTPAKSAATHAPLVTRQLEQRAARHRPRLLWAGRLDRQKRFDLLIDIAEALPEIDFAAWGKAVLESDTVPKSLPQNLTLNPPFTKLEELPLAQSDGWLYTSAWDGLPTILIEAAALGVPIVASAVGGVPELIDEDTGWPVENWQSVPAYVAAIRQMLADPDERLRRATALQTRAKTRHQPEAYRARLAEIMSIDSARLQPKRSTVGSGHSGSDVQS